MDWITISKAKDISQVRESLSKLDIHERDERGRTPLHIFLTNRAPIEAIQLLLDHGADLEAVDRLGDTPLKKAVKFQLTEAVQLLLAYGAKLDSVNGILESAWNIARHKNVVLADLLMETTGAIRLTLTEDEDQTVDDLLNQDLTAICQDIPQLASAELLHAVVQRYNWDNGPEAMLTVLEHPACAEITLLDMYELLEGDYWLELEKPDNPVAQACKMLAVKLKPIMDNYAARFEV
ncbi:DUF4274 domain-containing protein [Gracilibacillus alcaliphilus]|uniref:DUF4274 domain-containing protein n=1 Tax=Gracilibacillus alcaliphilus TaxID=1401441 RepID=UPI001956B9AE|nr:DUF4274 domain-containing protein [Gracilibacillus alcaliphilus]MBM7675319.1 hypothetical protein [Gracilibacillus alcaliphilus]